MLRNKTLLRIIILIILIVNVGMPLVYADDEEEIDLNLDEINKIVESATKPINEPILNSKSAIIYDRETKKVIWGKNEKQKRPMASTTKIMTSIVVLENANLKDTVIISKKAANTGGSCLKVNTGDKVTVNDLLYGLMLRSGNDTAVALAEHVGGSVEGFINLMNKKAEELQLKNTHFVTPHGLDDDEHYTTAYELAVITDYALKNEKFAQIVNTKTCTININGMPRQIANTNELLGNLNGVNGVKTGFTGNAMRCLVTSCTRNGNQIITVVLGADTKSKRTEDSIKLIEYAFSNYERINLEEIAKKEFEKWKQINEKRIYIYKAENKNVEVKLNEIKNKKIPIKKGSEKDIKVEINCIYNYEAPLPKLTKVGNLIIKNKEEIIETIDIQTKEEVKKKRIINYMFQFFGNLPTCLDFYK